MHQSKYVRYAELKRQFSNMKNETNLFVKNLKLDVTVEQLKKAFGQFGEVTSVTVKKNELKPGDVRGSGCVNFKVGQDAQKAQSEGHRFEGVKELFIENQEPYISFWQPKHVREQYKASKQRMAFYSRRILGFEQFPPAGGMLPVLPFPPRFMPYQIPMMNQPFGRPKPYPGRYVPQNQRKTPYGRPQQPEHRGQGGHRGGARQYTQQHSRGGYQQRTYQQAENVPQQKPQTREPVKEVAFLHNSLSNADFLMNRLLKLLPHLWRA